MSSYFLHTHLLRISLSSALGSHHAPLWAELSDSYNIQFVTALIILHCNDQFPYITKT